MSRVASVARRVGRRVRREVRGGLAARRPALAVVVLLDGEPAGVRRVLDSVLAPDQAGPGDAPGAAARVVVVVLTEALREPVREQVAGDERVLVVEAPGADRAAGRAAGVRAADAPAVVVLTPASPLVGGALGRLVDRRRRTGAEVVVGGLAGAPPETPGAGVSDLDAAPGVARTPLLARLLVGRDRLLAALSHDPGDPDGTAVALRLLTDGFAVEPAPCVRDVRPGTERALFRVSPWTAFAELLDADRAAGELLAAHPAALAERRAGLLERDLVDLAEAAEDADEEAWARLVDLLGPRVDEPALRGLPVEHRVLLRLAAQGDRAAVVGFVAARRLAGGALTTYAVDGRVRARLPLPDGAPPELLDLSPAQLVLRARLHRWRLVGDATGEVELVVQAGTTHLEESDPAAVRAGLTLLDGTDRLPLEVQVGRDPDVTRWLAERGTDHDAGALVARVPRADLAGRTWRVQVDLEVSGVRRSATLGEIDPRGSATRAALVDGAVVLRAPERPTGVLLDVGTDGEDLLLRTVPGAATAELVGPAVTLAGLAEGAGRWRFALVASTWGDPVRPAPTGPYRLHLDGAPVPADGLLDRLPEEHLTPAHRLLLRRGPGGALVVRLAAPLTDDELGPRAQQRLQTAYAEVREPLRPGLVYLQSFTGSAISDNPAAIQAELRGRPGAAGLDVRWAVADSAAGVPPGARPVLVRSREWYDVLARASHLVTNVDLEQWFHRREGQQVLQTSHGYPFKRMGLDQWRGRGFPAWRIEQELARSSGTWTAVVTPQSSVDSFYREQYAFAGPVLATGYPRDDALTDDRVAERRAQARARLGAGERKVLLYAPTWRDDLATDHRAALATHFVDLGALSERLGPDWLLLRRGHRFHAGQDGDGPGVLDVTAYPEVNDLMLAADVALLEYSSMRFDFALTGRPAVYYVPDLDRYAGEVRGFLHDYRDTAPGPLVTTLDEVAAELGDLDALAERWRPDIAAFNARYSALQDGHASARVVDAFFGSLLEQVARGR